MDVTIRPVRVADADAIATLLNRLIADDGQAAIGIPVSAAHKAEFIRGFPQHGVFHVAEDDGAIVGLQDILPLAVEPGAVGDIKTFVDPDRHRLGIGTRLGQASVAAARARGFTTLRAAIRADNAVALSFYRSLGFRMVGMAPEPVLRRGEPVDVLIAEASLGASS